MLWAAKANTAHPHVDGQSNFRAPTPRQRVHNQFTVGWALQSYCRNLLCNTKASINWSLHCSFFFFSTNLLDTLVGMIEHLEGLNCSLELTGLWNNCNLLNSEGKWQQEEFPKLMWILLMSLNQDEHTRSKFFSLTRNAVTAPETAQRNYL